MFIMFPAIAFAILFSFASSQSSQPFIPTTLPPCAQQCATLQQAQTGCVPPAAPVTDQGTYLSCFCESALLKPLSATPSTVCSACSPADLQTLQSWFSGFCAPAGGTGGQQPTTLTTSSISSTPTTSVPTVAPTGSTSQIGAGGATISDKTPPDNRDW